MQEALSFLIYSSSACFSRTLVGNESRRPASTMAASCTWTRSRFSRGAPGVSFAPVEAGWPVLARHRLSQDRCCRSCRRAPFIFTANRCRARSERRRKSERIVATSYPQRIPRMGVLSRIGYRTVLRSRILEEQRGAERGVEPPIPCRWRGGL